MIRMSIFDLFRRRSDRDRFALGVIRRAKERSWPHKIEYDREKFCLRSGTDGATFYLENVYGDWIKNDADGKRADVDRVVSTMFEGSLPLDWESSSSLLLPAVRNRRALECQWLATEGKIERAWWDGAFVPLCDSLAIVIAVDRPTSIALIDNRKFGEWNRSFEQLMEHAVLNLRERSPTRFERHPSGFYFSQYGDQYDCSRLLLPELFDLLSLNGDPVAIPVTRDGLVVAGSNDVSALCAMARFVEDVIQESARATAYLPLILRDKAWSVFEAEGPALEPLRDLVAKQALWDYECQRELLQAHCEQTGRDVWVGKIEANKFGSRVYTFSTWTQGVTTLLPRTDAVAINPGEQGSWFIRTWDDFWSVFSDDLVDEGIYPSRFQTPARMTEKKLERLISEFGLPPWLPTPQNDAHLLR